MTRKVHAKVMQSALPFSVSSENSKEEFSEEMEKAAVFFLRGDL